MGLFRLNRGITAIVVRCAYIVRMHGTKERVGSAIKVKLNMQEREKFNLRNSRNLNLREKVKFKFPRTKTETPNKHERNRRVRIAGKTQTGNPYNVERIIV